jgi:hypothetical protein
VSSASSLVDGMRHAAEAARKAGLLTYDDVDVAVDFHAGLALQAVRRMLRSGFDETYVLEVAALTLSGLGMERSRAASIARGALTQLVAIGPTRLAWWPSEPATVPAAVAV